MATVDMVMPPSTTTIFILRSSGFQYNLLNSDRVSAQRTPQAPPSMMPHALVSGRPRAELMPTFDGDVAAACTYTT